MADLPSSYQDFSNRLVLAGGRSSIPQNALRRCVACAPEPEPQVKSRYGSTTRYAVPNVTAITKGFSGTDHFLSDGTKLYKNSTVIDTGYNGNRVTFVKGPPALGLPDYLFVAGGGKLTKVDETGAVTNWGIAVPPNSMAAQSQIPFSTIIDNFNASFATGAWTATNCTLSDQTDAAFPSWDGQGSFLVTANPAGGLWRATRTGNINLSVYITSSGLIVPSLETDIISFYINVHNPANLVWVNLSFDVNDGTFTQDWYNAVVQLVPVTTNPNAANAALTIPLAGDQWTQIALPKSVFTRNGNTANLDWGTVKAIRLAGGNPNAIGVLTHFDLLTMYGGSPLGTGPTAQTANGATLKYLVTFGNSVTGNDSNSNDDPATVNNVALQPVNLSNIPISNDPQVTNRKIWRTSEDGAIFFFLDTIFDNVTTKYFDNTSSIAGPIVVRPWRPNVITEVVSGLTIHPYLVDGGNGFYFAANPPIAAPGTLNNAGTTGAVLPNWHVPTASWGPLSAFNLLNDTIIQPPRLGLDNINVPPNAFQVTQTGVTGPIRPNFATIPVGNSVNDGTVIWKNIGPLHTTDGTVTWSCMGLNSLPVLGSQQLLTDNAVFPAASGDGVFFEGSMLVTRDPANPNFIYISPPGRAEGYSNVIRVGTAGDPIQRLIVWDERVWCLTTQFIYPLTGTPPTMASNDLVVGAEGTDFPFTVLQTPIGIIHRASSGLRLFDGALDQLLGYAAISPIENGQTVENVAPFAPVIAAHCRNEVFFSDGTVTFAYHVLSTTWRMLGLGANALFYNDEFDLIEFARATSVVDFEVPGVFSDDGVPVSIEWQNASSLVDTTQQLVVKRVYLDCDLASQVVTPTLLVDGTDFPMPQVTNAARGTIEIAFQRAGRIMGVRLTGNVSARVTLYGIWADGRTGQ